MATPSQERQKQLIVDALKSFVSDHPEVRQASVVTEIPPPLKWAGMILAGVMTTAVTAGAMWLVASVQDVQVTLARLDERVASWTSKQDDRYALLESRVKRLEETQDKEK